MKLVKGFFQHVGSFEASRSLHSSHLFIALILVHDFLCSLYLCNGVLSSGMHVCVCEFNCITKAILNNSFLPKRNSVYLIPAYRFYRLHLRTSKLGDALGISRTCRHLLNKKKVPIQRLPHNACCVMRQNIQNIRNWCWCFEKSTVCLFFSVLVMEILAKN